MEASQVLPWPVYCFQAVRFKSLPLVAYAAEGSVAVFSLAFQCQLVFSGENGSLLLISLLGTTSV